MESILTIKDATILRSPGHQLRLVIYTDPFNPQESRVGKIINFKDEYEIVKFWSMITKIYKKYGGVNITDTFQESIVNGAWLSKKVIEHLHLLANGKIIVFPIKDETPAPEQNTDVINLSTKPQIILNRRTLIVGILLIFITGLVIGLLISNL